MDFGGFHWRDIVRTPVRHKLLAERSLERLDQRWAWSTLLWNQRPIWQPYGFH
jgi:hypothetical protein